MSLVLATPKEPREQHMLAVELSVSLDDDATGCNKVVARLLQPCGNMAPC